MAPLVAYRLERKWLLAALGLTLVCCLPLVLSGGGLCLTNSTGYFLQNAHFGPILLAENFEPGRWGDMDQIVWPPVVWQALTAAALACFALLIAAILQFAAGLLGTIRCIGSLSPHDAFMSGLVACMLLTSAAFIALLETRFDRYWMTALAPLLGLLAGLHPTAGNRAIRGIAWSLIGLQWTLSATFTHDYLAWNSARWRLFERSALHRKVAPNSIDGGYEINGWRRSADDPETKALPNAVRLWANPSGPRIAMMQTRPLNQNVADRASWTSWAMGGVDRQLYLIAPAD